MRKKWIVMGAGLGAGAIMLAASGLSAMAGVSGYDTWKSAAKQMKTVESVAGDVRLAIVDNGTKLADTQAAFKKDGGALSAKLALNAGGASQGLDVYLQDGKTVWKSSDSETYRVSERGGDKNGEDGRGWSDHAQRTPDPAMVEGVERVFDALVGNLKDRVTLESRDDGSKQVSLALSGSQVPVAVQAIGSLLISHASSAAETKSHEGIDARRGKGQKGIDEAAEKPLFDAKTVPELPKLTRDVRIDGIKLDATIDAGNYIGQQSLEIRIAGKDETDKDHTVVIQAQIDLNGVNATKADSIDLTGKSVEAVSTKSDHGRFRGPAQP
ncbi:hypothetical protein ACFFNY_08445 [Paenibacillus hodogayensis]|uniref:Uncharacterized protein n=1 Tax=Paenibacillus hodogayensis TaxID=279208 RepID=A0ABV5VU23_9BACL